MWKDQESLWAVGLVRPTFVSGDARHSKNRKPWQGFSLSFFLTKDSIFIIPTEKSVGHCFEDSRALLERKYTTQQWEKCNVVISLLSKVELSPKRSFTIKLFRPFPCLGKKNLPAMFHTLLRSSYLLKKPFEGLSRVLGQNRLLFWWDSPFS